MARPSAPGRRRVLLVINSLTRGGAETQLLGVARHLQDAGDEVVVATLRGGNDFADRVAEWGLTVWAPTDPQASWSVRWLWRLARDVRRWRPEVTISFLLQATLFTRGLNAVRRPRRAVASMRNERLESRLRTVVYRATCFLDDVVVVNSASARRTLQRNGTIPRDPDRSAVIYNGVDPAALAARAAADPAETRRGLGVAPGTTLLLGVGRLSAQKDWPTLVAAVATLPAGAGVVCVVAGEGPLEADLRAQVDAAGLAGRFRLLGLRHDVPDLLRAADCLVLSSTHEGTPNVVLEALATGLPVVATDVGACRELLDGEPACALVAPRDPHALGRALAQVAARGRRPPTTSTHGARSVERFSWDTVGAAWVAVSRDPAPGPAPARRRRYGGPHEDRRRPGRRPAPGGGSDA